MIRTRFGVVAGFLLLAMGSWVALGWALRRVAWVTAGAESGADFTPMVFNTALAFACCGIALLVPFGNGTRHRRVTSFLGGVVVALAAISLLEHLFDWNSGLDWAGLHGWLAVADARPGQMPPGSAAAFLMAGMALLLAPRARDSVAETTVRGLTVAVGTIGVLGLVGHLVQARILFPTYPIVAMGIHTAASFVVLAFGLGSGWNHYAWGRRPLFRRQDDQVTFLGALVLGGIAVAAGLASFAILQDRVQSLVGQSVLASLERNAEVIVDLVEVRESSARIAATRPAVIQNLRVIHSGRDGGSNLANVRAVVANLNQEGLTGVAYSDEDGRIVASGGTFAADPALAVALPRPDGGELLWKDGFVLRHRLAMRDGKGKAGEVLVEQALPVLNRLAKNPSGLGSTGDMGLCVRRGDRLHCFPQKLNPRVFSVPVTNGDGLPFPMTRAISGESGVGITRDYRQQNVVAAFGPLAALGMGMVLKVDAEEVFRPIREQLQAVAVVLACLVALGTLLLRWKVKPIARKLVEAEAHARSGEESLREKNAELQDANLAKSRFLASMSHELRTPLNAVIGFTGTLLMKLPGPLTADQERQLRIVQTSGRHLLALISELLDLARIEAGRMETRIEPVVFQRVVEEVAESLRPQAEGKGLRLELSMPAKDLVLRTDRRLASQIVINLLGNAIKFTDHGGVRVRVRERTADGPRAVEVAIEDTGIGIRAQDQSQLFEAFARVEESGSPREGTGLGLHVSQRIAVLLGGRITLRSESGKGSAFTLVLPDLERAPP